MILHVKSRRHNNILTSQILPKIDHKNPYFPFVQISAQFERGASSGLRAYSYLGAYKKFSPEDWAFNWALVVKCGIA